MASDEKNSKGVRVPDDMIEQIAKQVGPGAVFGESVVHGDTAVIPVATISFGGGAGGGSGEEADVADAGSASAVEGPSKGEGSGFGFGAKASPVGMITVTADDVSYKPVIDYSRLASIWSVVSGVALLMLVAGMVFSGRDR